MPQVTPLTERRHDGGYIVWEPSNGIVTRKEAVLLSGVGICAAGLVLGKVAHALAGVAAAQGGNTGNPTFGAIVIDAPAVAGVYTVTMLDADDFVVADPAGAQIGHGDLGVAFDAGGVAFTLTAGGVAAVAGDSFTITVAAGSGKYVPYDPTGQDGREIAAAILYGERDATSADRKCVVNHQGPMRVNASELMWGANVTTTQHRTDALAHLAALPGGGIQAT